MLNEIISTTQQNGLILSDVGGTLIDDNDKPNSELISYLNRLVEQGFKVQLITGGVDSGTYTYDKSTLRKGGLNPDVIDNARGKKEIELSTYKDVIAIIDDHLEYYISLVIKQNPSAKNFVPDDIQGLSKHIGIPQDPVKSIVKDDSTPESSLR